MTSKRVFLQKVTALLTSTTKKGDFTKIKQLFWVFLCHNDHHRKFLGQNANRKYRRSGCTSILTNLLLTLQNDSHECF